jgi:hypothetical protein
MSDVIERPVIAACSFCLKPNTEVARLVAGPGVFICDECVALCGQLVEGKQAPARRPGPWEQMLGVEELLTMLPKVAAAHAQVERSLTLCVRQARELGATWARIGAALGMTRQSAWERFSGEE